MTGREKETPHAASVGYAAPDALRAARALRGLTQPQLAASVGMCRKSVAACESGVGATLKSMATLRNYYDRVGIEFLGTLDQNNNTVHGSGACWKFKDFFKGFRPFALDDVNFAAARALLGLTERFVAEKSFLTPRQVGNLERGQASTTKSYDSLRDFFEEKGVEFLSHKTSRVSYISLGVRLACLEIPLLPHHWANRESCRERAQRTAVSAFHAAFSTH
ncbi:helix-turn-helix transcriptional regulator [Rhizobium ruizarguesonis]|nr:helix-turn-helix transcriptional regulator [Rhizobium ruizarguesonis]